MDAGRISRCAEEIERNKTAIQWLGQYGLALQKDQVYIQFQTYTASACVGYSEAMKALGSYAQSDIREMVEKAMRGCQNTIEILEETIRQECAK